MRHFLYGHGDIAVALDAGIVNIEELALSLELGARAYSQVVTTPRTGFRGPLYAAHESEHGYRDRAAYAARTSNLER